MPGILVFATIQVHEVLRPRKERTLAYTAVRRQALHLEFQSSHHLVHEPPRNPQPLRRIHKAEQNDMAEQHPPMHVEAGQQRSEERRVGKEGRSWWELG